MTERVSDWRAYEPLPFDRVLEAAVRAFLAKGYHGASIRDVAGEAGMSVPGIYHHHESKQAMLREILSISVADLLYRSLLARTEGADAMARFSNMVESVVLFHTNRRDVGFIAASEMRSLERPFLDDFLAQRVEQQRMIDVEVEAGYAAGGFTVADPHLAARAVITMCTATAQWYDPHGPSTPSDLATSYVKLAQRMMGSSPQGRGD